MQYVLPSDQEINSKFLKQTMEISQQHKSPSIFKWKTASIVLGALSSIVLVIIAIVFYNLESQEEFETNLTFLSSIATNTQILTTKKELVYLSLNFQGIYGETKFQKAVILEQDFTHFSQINLRDAFYQQNQKLLFLFQIQSDDDLTTKFAIFMNSPFPMPKFKQFNYNTTYYSFQINENRKSSLLSLNSLKSITLKPSSIQIKSPLQCQTYNFQTNNDEGVAFKMLNNLIEFSLKTVDMKVNTEGYRCFTPEFNEDEFRVQVEGILGKKIDAEGLRFKNSQVYHLE